MSASIGDLPVQSSLLAAPSAAKRVFGLVWGVTKCGKTTFAAGLDAVTQETLGKRTLIAACEKAQGAGLERVAHLDIPIVAIRASSGRTALDNLLAVIRDPAVASTYGGFLLDGVSELGNHDVREQVLSLPANTSVQSEARKFGVMIDNDYGVFAEAIRQIFAALAVLNDKGVHVLVTAGERTYTHREKGAQMPVVDCIGPAFAGQGAIKMVEALVPTVFEVTQSYRKGADGKPIIRNGKPVLGAYVNTVRDGVRLRGDRTGLWPDSALAIVEDDKGRPVSNLPAIYREHWLAASGAVKSAA